MERKATKEFVRKSLHAKKEHKKGRAMGCIITGIRKEIKEYKSEKIFKEQIQERQIEVDNEMWKIFIAYNDKRRKKGFVFVNYL